MGLLFIKDFFKTEVAGSAVLILAALLAMVAANSPLLPYYALLHEHTPTLAINDGLMAFFFLVIGMEIRHEMHGGSLSNRRQVALPFMAALGGIVLPALIFTCFNWETPAQNGWAIPSATDIAFSLGILAFFGRSVPAPLRMFLMMVAIIDDIAAVLIIAFFYSENVYPEALAMAGFCVLLLYAYNRNVNRALPFVFIGAALWVAMLASGVHASLAGVIVGLLLPLDISKKFLPKLHPWVAFGVVPIFAFANAGVPLDGLGWQDITHVLPLGIAIGLFIGKQLGVFLTSWIMIRCRFADLPGNGWLQFYGVCVLAGIGFTMSLFIGALAFPFGDMLILHVRIGVIIGSLASAIIGAILLALVNAHRKGVV